MPRTWVGPGPAFRLEWGGREWTLDVAAETPGLRADGLGPLLGLDGIAETGRSDPSALSGATLSAFELRQGRVEATYAPPEWGELTVRASWWPTGDAGVDLLIQLSARSVARLRHVEVKLASLWPDLSPTSVPPHRWVEPRDDRAAQLSYDGRERDVESLTTLATEVGTLPGPRTIRDDAGRLYVEMVHPEDMTRRIVEGGPTMADARTTRYGLFGYDLERGVVLRGRLRALWLPSGASQRTVVEQAIAFLREPLPLGT